MNRPAQKMLSHMSSVMNLPHPLSSLDRSIREAARSQESEIMSAAQSGSTAAFDELQRRYSRSLFKTILRLTNNREDAEDALQDTFLRAYLALRSFEGRSSVYSWLTRIAINSALMVLRRRRARPDTFFASSVEGEEGYPAREIADRAPNPEQLYAFRQWNNRLLNAIQQLEPRLREPIEIQLCHEASMKQIADTLNVSVSAVKARLYRARVHLSKRVPIHSGSRKARSSGQNTARLPSTKIESSPARPASEMGSKSFDE